MPARRIGRSDAGEIDAEICHGGYPIRPIAQCALLPPPVCRPALPSQSMPRLRANAVAAGVHAGRLVSKAASLDEALLRLQAEQRRDRGLHLSDRLDHLIRGNTNSEPDHGGSSGRTGDPARPRSIGTHFKPVPVHAQLHAHRLAEEAKLHAFQLR